MNYDYIESLVHKSKINNSISKENLINEFKPLILSICKKTFIHGYENEDIINECYSTLFRCITLYNPESHRFVAYATNAIKNNINDLIKKNKRKSLSQGNEALILSDNLEYILCDSNNLEEIVLNNLDYTSLKSALSQLNSDEIELIDFIFFKNNSLKLYSYWKKINYSAATKKKSSILKKLNTLMNVNLNQ